MVALLTMAFLSSFLGGVLAYFRSSLSRFVRKSYQTTSYSLVHFRYIDCCVTVPISVLTAIANIVQISALYLDANDASSTTREVDRSLASAMIAVRIIVAFVSLYLVDASVRRNVWKQFVLTDYLDPLPFLPLWVTFLIIILIDPSQVRFLPFMRSPFSEHSGGYPNLDVFTICMSCTIVSSMAVFMLSAVSMAYIPLGEVIVSTVLSGLWFVITTTITLLRLARPVDVDEIIDLSVSSGAAAGGGGGGGGGGMQSAPKGAYRNYGGGVGQPTFDSLGNPLSGSALARHSESGGQGFEMRKSGIGGARIDEMRLSGSRAATQPIRSPTPPKRINLGAVLDNIPDPVMNLQDAKVASYAHQQQQLQQQQEAEAATGIAGEGDDVSRRTFVSSDRVSQRVPFSFNYSVHDDEPIMDEVPAAASAAAEGGEEEEERDEGPKQRRPFT